VSGRPPATPPEDVTTELDSLLGQLAERLADEGTRAERPALQAVAYVTRRLAPGAAAALVDWWGTETARLRAYGLLHGVVLRDLDPVDKSWLLDRLEGAPACEPACRVA
jgi:hypothetical protein